MELKKVVILGSTGSIGINTLKVIERFPDKFRVIGLTAYNNFKLLDRQIEKFKPEHVAVSPRGIKFFEKKYPNPRSFRIHNVFEDLEELVRLNSVDLVVIAMRGSAALRPFLAAVKAGKTVAPANKEALVVAGDIIMKEAKRRKVKILPIDSEQSAIFQCLEGRNGNQVKKIYLTASGGSLLKVPLSRFKNISVEKILSHPRWKMGKKITVDSATLMNKGFEVIEAKWLFDLSIDDIQVVVHPEAIIHSMVEFVDGSILAQLGITDMRLPIQYALTYPSRWPTGLNQADFFRLKQLNFRKPDIKKFPSLSLAINVGRKGGTLPSVLNAADEEAVEAFLSQKIKFQSIYNIVEKIVIKHKQINNPDIKDILAADRWAREEAARYITKRP